MSEKTKPLHWGIMGLGWWAGEFVAAINAAKAGKLCACASRSADKAQAFAEKHHIPNAYDSYEKLLADPDIDIIHLPLPHPFHKEWVIKAAEAGKHILCEKPMAMNAAETQQMIDAARKHDVFLLEAFRFRFQPQHYDMLRVVANGDLGEVRFIRAAFAVRFGQNVPLRLSDKSLGAGSILDLGCYPMALIRQIAGVSRGLRFAEPNTIQGMAQKDTHGVDYFATAQLGFDDRLQAEAVCGMLTQGPVGLEIYGTEGRLIVPDPWSGTSGYTLTRPGHPEEELYHPAPTDAAKCHMAYELEACAKHLHEREAPQMTLDDSLGNAKALDRWLKACDVKY